MTRGETIHRLLVMLEQKHGQAETIKAIEEIAPKEFIVTLYIRGPEHSTIESAKSYIECSTALSRVTSISEIIEGKLVTTRDLLEEELNG